MRPIEAKAISAIRVLSADTVQKANSGHPGMPIGIRQVIHLLLMQHSNN